MKNTDKIIEDLLSVVKALLTEMLHNQKEIKHTMSTLSDAIQAVADKQTALEAGLAAFKTDLDKAIADLLAKIAAGGVQQSDLDALTALGGRIDAVAGTVAAEDVVLKQADQ